MVLLEWGDFWAILTEAAVALLALLFVSFQITRDRWIKSPMRKLVAIQTLFEFLVPTFFGLIALLPILIGKDMEPWRIGGVLTAALGLGMSVVVIRFGIKNSSQLDPFGRNQLKMQPLALGEYLLLLGFSVAGNITGAAIILVWLLFSGDT